MGIVQKALTPHMFNRIARRYDLLNLFLSWGLDSVWRKAVLQELPQHKFLRVLDVATGTGDQLLALLDHPNVCSVVGLDPSSEMLQVARQKLRRRQVRKPVELENASVEQMPFLDGAFDAVTMSFGIRNVPNVEHALKEMYRVLKPGGRIILLELSLPKPFLIRRLHGWYLRWVVPRVGAWVSGDREAYTYLEHSIQTFARVDVCRSLQSIGFRKCEVQRLTFGVATLYTASREL